MLSKPKLSIIIPVYNLELYIADTIKSCIEQDISSDEYEIICIDDGSTDNSIQILNALTSEHDNIKFFTKSNGGVSQTRNYGLEKATGEYVWFVDGDDLIAPNCLKALINISDNENPDILAFRMIHFSEEPRFEGTTFDYKTCVDPDKMYSFMFGLGGGGVCVNLYRTALLKDANIHFDEKIKYSEDVLFHFSVLLKASKCVKTNSLLYYYRQREGSAMHSSGSSDKFIESMRLLIDGYNGLLNNTSETLWRKIIIGNRNRAVKALLFSLVKSGDVVKTQQTIRELSSLGFYPYPLDPKTLIKNKSMTQFLINWFSFLFPIKLYTMAVVKCFNLIKK